MKKRIILLSLIVAFVVSLILINKFFNFKVDTTTTISTSTTLETSTLKTTSLIIVDIEGEVLFPGVYKIEEGSMLFELIELAGGLTQNAKTDGINKAQVLYDKAYIFISSESGESIITYEDAISSSKVNINKATLEELKTIYGIGDALAKAIIDYRVENGSYKQIEDIMNVPGIGKLIYEKIKDYITV